MKELELDPRAPVGNQLIWSPAFEAHPRVGALGMLGRGFCYLHTYGCKHCRDRTSLPLAYRESGGAIVGS